MVRASRKKVVIGLVIFIAAAVAVVALHPVRDVICLPFLSAAEKRVVGTWHAHMIGGVNVTTIHADHTWSSVGGSCLGDDFAPITGHWRLAGSEIIFSLDPHQFGDLPTPDSHRYAIEQLIDGDRQTRAWEATLKK
jgi:hypothetical protein